MRRLRKCNKKIKRVFYFWNKVRVYYRMKNDKRWQRMAVCRVPTYLRAISILSRSLSSSSSSSSPFSSSSSTTGRTNALVHEISLHKEKHWLRAIVVCVAGCDISWTGTGLALVEIGLWYRALGIFTTSIITIPTHLLTRGLVNDGVRLYYVSSDDWRIARRRLLNNSNKQQHRSLKIAPVAATKL